MNQLQIRAINTAQELSNRVFMGAIMSTLSSLSRHAAEQLSVDIEEFSSGIYQQYVNMNGAGAVNPQVKGFYDKEIAAVLDSIETCIKVHIKEAAKGNGKGGE